MTRDEISRRPGRRTALLARLWAGACFAASGGHALAADGFSGGLFHSSEVISLALLAGAGAAATISMVWLSRQRARSEAENRDLTAMIADANQRVARLQALLSEKDRRIVVWESPRERPEFLGQLPAETGAPADDRDFLAFGRWIKAHSAAALDHAIEALRSRAESFDLIVDTLRGEIVEVQGRVSGGRAFVRFVALSNLRAELAEARLERDRLRTALQGLHALLDATDLPVWQRGTDGKLSWVNEAYRSAVEARTSAEAIAEGREFLPTLTREKIRAGATYDVPFRDTLSAVVHGNRRVFEVIDAKTTQGSAGLAIDVSSIESVREELARTLKSHAETLDQLTTPVAIFDGAQRLEFYNQAFQRLWDLDTATLMRKPDNGEILDRLRERGKLPEQLNWRQWKENALSVYQAIDTQTDLWHLPNGQTLRVVATARPQGGATWVFENLTERVDLETRYNTLLHVQGETIDHLAEGVSVFGPDGRIRLSNPAFRALWGVTETQVQPGTHIKAIEQACAASYDMADGWKRFAQLITSFDDERPSYRGILELRTGLILDFAVIPLPNAQTMLTFVNITDSVRVERALKEKNEALQMADALKNDFVQHVSYELRSPLTNIIGFADLLKTPAFGTLTPRQAEYVDHIATSSSLLLTIVNDILDLATVDAGIVELDLSEIDLGEFLDEVALHMADRLQESGVLLTIEAPETLGRFVADHQRLKQIFIKLIANAAKVAPEGSTIALACRREGTDFVFSVKDKGPGIPPEVIASVFNRFESHGSHGGAGLGLSIVESFVTLHRGSVAIRSCEAEGTEVTCRLPAGELRQIAAE
ncbi:alkaline phosphatase [Rhizobium rhizosphaerae]|uniref:histidine kinase n=1 Tax=Xaviernesmea rhizosphaerae TaxID=1672749 RepID=A0ABX3PCH0_9HYPH|nr:PAS domain-containing sensor histidine kinase [Xaviernesmea rhizosphaerae]OQP86171.1 alkaline phosphatase [Xaviernesmea rhizosphaerae]